MALSDDEIRDLDRFNELREMARKGVQLTTRESTELTILEVKLGL